MAGLPAKLPDDIYEAAFVPELWSRVLSDIAERAGAASSSLLLFRREAAPRFKATPVTEAALGQHVITDDWKASRTADTMFRLIGNPDFLGFSYVRNHMSAAEVAQDSVIRNLNRLGLDAQIGTIIPMMTGEVVVITFERWTERGRFTQSETATLDALRSDLARASLMAARLGLERARGSVAAMEALGLPAAVLSGRRVLAANGLFAREDAAFRIGAGDRIALSAPASDALFQATLADGLGDREGACIGRSIPLAAAGECPARVVHVLPLRRAAHEIFSGDALVAVTAVGVGAALPQMGVLAGLFDLTPAEARLAIGLAAGPSLKEAAAAAAIQISTARSYLEQIFRKTGTHRQSQLAALLRSTQPPGR